MPEWNSISEGLVIPREVYARGGGGVNGLDSGRWHDCVDEALRQAHCWGVALAARALAAAFKKASAMTRSPAVVTFMFS